jgi:uncharacterized protein (TIGR03083 family)
MPQTRMPRAAAATRVTPEKWAAVRAAVREAGERFADLILSVPDPSVLATKDWSVAETAAHVTGTAWNYTAGVAEGEQPLPIPEVRPHWLTTTVDTIHTDLNPVHLSSYPERDPARLAERLRASIAEILSTTADAAPERIITWLGGSRLPLAGVLAHMMNELLIHGQDIARAAGVPWRIADDQAALFFDLFLVEIIRNGYGRLLDDDRPVRPGRIAVEFRSAYTTPVTIVLDSGEVSVEEPSGDCDVRIRFRPAALNLVLFHRIGHVQAALTGSLVVWGRRPWLLPAFLRTVRLP